MKTLIVIGGGPAGITAALEAAALGAAVTLVSAEPVGGRANWHSLVPSKVYLTAADALEDAQRLPALGLPGASSPVPDLPVLRARIATQAHAWSQYQQEQLHTCGVNLVFGKARFLDPYHLQVEQTDREPQTLAFTQAILATGSEPVFLPQLKPDGRLLIAPRHVGQLTTWPRQLLVIGGGVTGAEFAYFFNRMGSQVTWITDQPVLLPQIDADLSAVLEQTLCDRGVAMIKGAAVQAAQAQDDEVRLDLADGRQLRGSQALIAIGRRPDLAGLDLETAGIAWTAQGVTVDAFGRTSVPHIFAAGDVTGAPCIANRGQAQARVAARCALDQPTPPFRPETIIEAVYTSPQLAQVGLIETQALAQGRAVKVYRANFSAALKSRLADTPTGFIKLLVTLEDGRVIGGAAVGERAAEVLSTIAVAIAGEMTLKQVASVFPAYPTLAELVGIAARGY